MSENQQRASEIESVRLSTSDALDASSEHKIFSNDSIEINSTDDVQLTTLASLPIGARLIVQCRADWREAVVAAITDERITLSILAPSGRTYRIRRPPDAPLTFEGALPILGAGSWRALLARSDKRW